MSGSHTSNFSRQGVTRVCLGLACAYVLLLIPEGTPRQGAGAGRTPFRWSQAQFWAHLEHDFVQARSADKTVVSIDPHDPFSNTGAKGVGEPATIPTAPAIANAVFHATGLRLTDAPMSPARMLNAMASQKPAPAGQKGRE